jgi:hypothetical protein
MAPVQVNRGKLACPTGPFFHSFLDIQLRGNNLS